MAAMPIIGPRRPRRPPRPWWAPPPPPRRRSRSGFRFVGPFPAYSTRTRRGSRVTVGGCCLPLPLTLAVALGALGRRALRG